MSNQKQNYLCQCRIKSQKSLFDYVVLLIFFSSFLTVSLPTTFASDLARLLAASRCVVRINVEAGGIAPAPPPEAAAGNTGTIAANQPLRVFHFQTSGGGIVLTPAGIIVTNAHILQAPMRITVTFKDGTTLPASILHVEPGADLALLKVDSDQELPYLPLSDSDQLELGQAVYSLGSSTFLSHTLSEGQISALGQHQGQTAGIAVILINFKVYPGDSGSPVLNGRGEVVGITTAGQTSGKQETYAIASNVIREALENYEEKIKTA